MRALTAGLAIGLLLSCAGGDQGPIEVEQGWQMEGVLVERRGDLLIVRSDGGQTVELMVRPKSQVRLEAKALPSIEALFEGDRVLAIWQGDVGGGEALEVLVTGELGRAPEDREMPSGDWVDTMDSPGGTMGSPAHVGIRNFRPPLSRQGPARPNPATGQLVPADMRPSF